MASNNPPIAFRGSRDCSPRPVPRRSGRSAPNSVAPSSGEQHLGGAQRQRRGAHPGGARSGSGGGGGSGNNGGKYANKDTLSNYDTEIVVRRQNSGGSEGCNGSQRAGMQQVHAHAQERDANYRKPCAESLRRLPAEFDEFGRSTNSAELQPVGLMHEINSLSAQQNSNGNGNGGVGVANAMPMSGPVQVQRLSQNSGSGNGNVSNQYAPANVAPMQLPLPPASQQQMSYPAQESYQPQDVCPQQLSYPAQESYQPQDVYPQQLSYQSQDSYQPYDVSVSHLHQQQQEGNHNYAPVQQQQDNYVQQQQQDNYVPPPPGLMRAQAPPTGADTGGQAQVQQGHGQNMQQHQQQRVDGDVDYYYVSVGSGKCGHAQGHGQNAGMEMGDRILNQRGHGQKSGVQSITSGNVQQNNSQVTTHYSSQHGGGVTTESSDRDDSSYDHHPLP